ncbi:MAG: hypothetical protein K2M94_08705 [Paramuribaculum sp.]|nr:hypothetical protein [Paramuribaculum sp.]
MSPLSSIKKLPAAAPAAGSSNIHTADELTVGMTITHDRFGEGKITKIDTSQPDVRIQVDFHNTGSRLLLLKFARFTIKS